MFKKKKRASFTDGAKILIFSQHENMLFIKTFKAE